MYSKSRKLCWRNIFLSGSRYCGSVFCWRVTNKLTKDPVRVRKRLKTHLVGYLGDAQVLVVQQDFSFLNADAAQVLHKRSTGCMFELPAKVERAYIASASNLFNFDRVRLMTRDVIFRPCNHRRIFPMLLQRDLVSDQCEMFSENFQKSHYRTILIG